MDFEIAAGSVLGREHARAGRNNQDAFAIQKSGATVAAIVCDGCGSAPHSDVGAKIISRWMAKFLSQRDWSEQNAKENLNVAGKVMTRRLRSLACTMGERKRVAHDYFLATILGAVISDDVACVFSLGDGLILLNGATIAKCYPGNAPPYLAYGIMGKGTPPFEINFLGHADDLDELILASDGAEEIDRLCEESIPGKQEPIGRLRQFVDHDAFFKNPAAIHRRLHLINRSARDAESGFSIPGRLGDDTTVIAIRRKRTTPKKCEPISRERASA